MRVSFTTCFINKKKDIVKESFLYNIINKNQMDVMFGILSVLNEQIELYSNNAI